MSNNFGFTGEPTDPNGLVYLRNRYYDPETATFLSLDPYEGTPNRPMSLNGYSYVEGNPTNMTDPSGLSGLFGGEVDCDYLRQQGASAELLRLNGCDVVPTATPYPSGTPLPTVTPPPTVTPMPTITPTYPPPIITSTPTMTPTLTPNYSPTPTYPYPTPGASPSQTATCTATGLPTSLPTGTITPTPRPTSTPNPYGYWQNCVLVIGGRVDGTLRFTNGLDVNLEVQWAPQNYWIDGNPALSVVVNIGYEVGSATSPNINVGVIGGLVDTDNFGQSGTSTTIGGSVPLFPNPIVNNVEGDITFSDGSSDFILFAGGSVVPSPSSLYAARAGSVILFPRDSFWRDLRNFFRSLPPA